MRFSIYFELMTTEFSDGLSMKCRGKVGYYDFSSRVGGSTICCHEEGNE